MKTRASFAGAPIHPMFVHYPIALWTTSVITDLIFYFSRNTSLILISKFLIAAALLSAATLAPGLADARHNRHHLPNWGLPYPISYLHNYGPGPQPGTFAYYDGPSTVLCRQGAAA